MVFYLKMYSNKTLVYTEITFTVLEVPQDNSNFVQCDNLKFTKSKLDIHKIELV